MSLDALLAAANELLDDENEIPNVKLKEVNEENEDEVFLGSISNYEPSGTKKNKDSFGNAKNSKKDVSTSHIHTGDTDSSDDEQNRDYESAKLNDFGKNVKKLLAADYPSKSDDFAHKKKDVSWKKSKNAVSNTPKTNDKHELGVKSEPTVPFTKDVYTDPIFGIRIINPLISSVVLQERMLGRDAVHFAKLKFYLSKLTADKNWVIAGVIIRKTAGKTSAKGHAYSIWTLSDLHGELKTVTLFLFSNANKELWKLQQGTVVGILNPNVMESRGNNKEEATLSVDNAQKVMIMGQSKDFGQCKSTTKGGDRCTAFVNTHKCEFCVFHVRKEYQKCSSGRTELQSSFVGKGLTALRNKVLGKNEVFYAGKSYTAIPAKKSKKLETQDKKRLDALNGKITNFVTSPSLITNKSTTKKKLTAPRLDISYAQKAKDLALLKKLGGRTDSDSDILDKPTNTQQDFTLSSNVTLEESKNNALRVIAKLKAKQNEPKMQNTPNKTQKESGNTQNNMNTDNVPTINKAKSTPMGFTPTLSGSGSIDLNAPISRRQVNRAKVNAIKYIRQHGPIKKVDPMSTKGAGVKRINDEIISKDPKKQKIMENEFLSDRFKKMIATTSKHMDLLEQHDNEEQEKYFGKMEMKERMEEKMMSTYKIECKAVRCLQCKYTNFSAAERCKLEKHPLKVFDSFKRFFKCGDCGHRTCCLEIVPVVACKNCGSGKWERTTMMKEKIATGEQLSIRGGEQTFLNSNVSNANLNLLVPEA